MLSGAIRILFSKQGRIKFISHLDTCRVLRGAFVRAGIKLRYSEGFNPHPRLTLALPLSLGHESICEMADVILEQPISESDLVAQMNAALPEGIAVISAASAIAKYGQLGSAKYKITFDCPEHTKISILLLNTAASLCVDKTTKSGKTKSVDVRAGLKSWEISSQQDSTILTATLSVAGESYTSPDLLVTALSNALPNEWNHHSICRQEIYTSTGEVFR